ncbi:cytochrome c oxidase assembly protein [Agromyces sp. Marseille-Q5079]|uniref:cytochrome c oxidase assembly protein n=1 Tax=Agromyces sp. Marseille-Q5079 TaxID=3439059 RepID=UPI003D9C7F1A
MRHGDVSGPVSIPDQPPSLEAFLAIDLQPVPVLPVVAALLAAAYTSGWIRLRWLGRPWPAWRALLFLLGCAIIAAVTATRLEGYGYALFSVFMFQQLTLMMAVPPLLVLGSPGTLLLRAMPHHGIGLSLLRLAVWGLRSSFSRFLLHPGLMVPLFLFAFYGIYLSKMADSLLRTWPGHLGLELFFLAAGILFTIPLISADPLPRRQSHLGRLFDLFAEMPLHAFFGVIVMMAVTPLIPYFGEPPPSWGIDPVADQGIAGALAWSYGEAPTLALALVLLGRWYRDDTRRAHVRDARIDRTGDPELEAYNSYLRRLQARDHDQGIESGSHQPRPRDDHPSEAT